MYRQEAHLSQDELANRIYVSRQTISNWENDKSYPDVHSLVLLSEIFQISLDKLIKGDIEVMKDVTFRIAPLTDVDAEEMIENIKKFKPVIVAYLPTDEAPSVDELKVFTLDIVSEVE